MAHSFHGVIIPLVTASFVGVLFAMMLFFLEPMWFFKGRYYMPERHAFRLQRFTLLWVWVWAPRRSDHLVVSSAIRSLWRPRHALPVYVFVFLYLTFAVVMRALVIYGSLPLSKLLVAIIVLMARPARSASPCLCSGSFTGTDRSFI